MLSEISEIRSISTYKHPQIKNAIMTGFTQQNSFSFQRDNQSNIYYLDRYLNNKGLRGGNQTITILDTPIDFYHSNFRDEKVQVKLNTYMPNHRKIIYYGFKGNLNELTDKMSENEHGTHCAGIAAGSSICQNDELKRTKLLNGIAPDSKILYAGHFNEVDHLEVVNMMNKYNSRISSNSWGSDGFNLVDNYLYGRIAKENPNLTFIFAAGNEYQYFGNFSVGDPSGSKNVLAVGSIKDFYNEIYFKITSKNNPNLVILAYGSKFFDPWFSGSIGTEPGKTDILVIDSNKGDQCNILHQNNYFMFYGNNYRWMIECDFNYSGFFVIQNSYMEIMKEILDSKSDIHIERVIGINRTRGIEHADYSSTGPANKGILKPDVVAPGTNIISAKSRAHSNSPHGCRDENEADFIMISGTSMATPNVAGAAALIHEYFLSGEWNSDKVILDGATTRALLINSCRHPLNSKSPDIIFGHGVVDLSTIIPIENDFGVQIISQNVDKKPVVTNKGHVISRIKVDTKLNKKDLQITLSYIDVMLGMDSPIPLTRDLDLVVVSPSKKIFIGDHLQNYDSQHFSTNEKIIIRNKELEDGEYIVHIYGNLFVDSLVFSGPFKQEFSVVASGPIPNGYIEFSDSSECPCDKCDTKNPGYCLCDQEKELGPICQSKIETLHGTEGAFYVQPLSIRHIKIISPKKIKYVSSKSMNPGVNWTIWISKTCHFTLGEYEFIGITGKDEYTAASTTKINYGTKEICLAIFNNNDRQANYIIEVSNYPKYFWIKLIFMCMAVLILVLFIFLCYLCCCRKKCCCGCCKCCNKDEMGETDTISQFSLHDRLISN